MAAERAAVAERVLRAAQADNTPRWSEGERLEQLFEQQARERPHAVAVDGTDGTITYKQLDDRANRLARDLVRGGKVAAGDRVALLLDKPVDTYVAMLAVLKLHAAYIPLDPAFPPDRIAFIVEDSGATGVLSRSHLTEGIDVRADSIIDLDERESEIANQASDPPDAEDAPDELCYVIYTSGTTGRPKGVAIGHPAIVNFVRVAAEVYGIEPDDRVYQGLTIAFDFSVEEIWVPWMAGATLVPNPTTTNLLGPELRDFIKDRGVTALCCVPTLLATLEPDELDQLRFVLVSGESCPQDLVERWHRPRRRFLNVYGPTEATVTATWCAPEPGKPVTIGVPLPTYAVAILDPDGERALDRGEEGEIAIAGIGLADGYLNNEEKTAGVFIEDFLAIPDNPSGKLYRTGDLGQINDDGEIEHHSRIDTQVKIRGYRIELAEIEAVLREAAGIEEAVVGTHESAPGTEELVAYCRTSNGELDVDSTFALLREKLPPYMVPVYLEPIDELPLLPSGKVDRGRLPEPQTQRRVASTGEHVEAESSLEATLAEEFAHVLNLDDVSVEANLFDELGASSLLLAQFSARVRDGHPELPALSMRDIYTRPTVRRLAEFLGDDSNAAPTWDEPELPPPIGTPRYRLCGALQLLATLLYAAAAGALFDLACASVVDAHGPADLYGRAVAFGAVSLLGLGLAPIAAKWILIGRFKPRRIRVWSVPYVRFWIVKTLIAANPLARLLVGTSVYPLYLRALGAKVGPGTLILTTHPPICPDMLTIGSDTVIWKDASLNCYRARDGVIEIGPVEIGDGVLIGEHAVLDIHTKLGDGSQLGHASALHAGQAVPAGACWHGSPAEPAPDDFDYGTVPALPCGRLRRARYSLGRAAVLLALVAPIEVALTTILLAHPASIVALPAQDGLIVAPLAVLAALSIAFLIAAGPSRLLAKVLEPGKAYPLYGVRYAIQRIVSRASNVPSLNALFGDSNAIVHYLRLVGYRFGALVQTGSNFGMTLRHEVPSLSDIGSGTMVSDGLSIANAEFSSSSFRVTPVRIGKENFLGNGIVFPARARTGDNCLLATKAMVPIAGDRLQNTGLLGAPPFQIPRKVKGDEEFEHLQREPERSRRLRAKRRHNVVTMLLHLLVRIVAVALLLLIAFGPFGGEGAVGWGWTVATELVDIALVPIVVFTLAERLLLRFRPLEPRFCSIYDVRFWRHERYWKVPSIAYLHVFDGTPLKGLIWRLLGVNVGGRVFDDGCSIIERTLTSIGAGCTLGMGSILQGHSLENGVFKSDRIELAAGTSVGTGAFIHYGTKLGEGSTVEADSFLMKGSDVASGSRWRGNPANEVREPHTQGARGGNL